MLRQRPDDGHQALLREARQQRGRRFLAADHAGDGEGQIVLRRRDDWCNW